MPTATYILGDGAERTYELRPGQSLMEGAVRNGVPGILAECGGSCMCATCHVYVEHAVGTLPEMGDDEDVMLGESIAERRPNSRLSCQIKLGRTLERVTARVAENM